MRCRMGTTAFLFGLALLGQPSGPVLAAEDLVPVETLRSQAMAVQMDAANFLSRTVRFRSVEDADPTRVKPETAKMLQFIFAEARKLGFATRLAAGGLAGVLEYGEGDETVGVLIHVDVVPAAEAGGAKWTHPPFSGAIEDGYVWGRGAQDDKGALTATLWGMKLLIDNGVTFKRKLRIIMGTKEEINLSALSRYFEEEKQPDFGIVPDGVYFIVGEKGIADMTVSFPGLTAPAPKRDTVTFWSGGTVINNVPNFSYMVLSSSDREAARAEMETAVEEATAELKSGKSTRFFGLTLPYSANLSVMTFDDFIRQYAPKDAPASGDLVILSHGKEIHGSAPWAGRNAIIETAFAASLLGNLSENAYSKAIRFVTRQMGLDYYGGGLVDAAGKGIPFDPPPGLATPPLGLSPVQYYGSSANLGLVAVDPKSDSLILSIDFRTGLGNTNEQLLAHTTSAANLHGGKTAYVSGPGSHFPAIHRPAEHPVMKMAIDAYRAVNPDYPKELPYLFFSPGTTYLKLVDNFVNFGPVDIYPDPSVNKFHQDDERIAIKDLTKNIVMFANVLERMLTAPSPVVPATR